MSLIHCHVILQITKLDVETREMKKWQAENAFPSEPVFIPTPEATEEDDGNSCIQLGVTLS